MSLLLILGDTGQGAEFGDILLVDADGAELLDADGAFLEEPI